MWTAAQKSEAGYDAELVAAYLAGFHDCGGAPRAASEPDLNAIFRMPGVFGGDGRFGRAGSKKRCRRLRPPRCGRMGR